MAGHPKGRTSQPHVDSRFGAWPKPKSRDIAAPSDPTLYAEVLEIAEADGAVSADGLMSQVDGLRQRFRRLWLVERPTKTAIGGLLQNLQAFGWLTENVAVPGQYVFTNDGETVAREAVRDHKRFRRILAAKMQARYVVPGWLVARLLAINPRGQGEVVLPSPPREWRPEHREWEAHQWSEELKAQAVSSAREARKAFAGSFPVSDQRWAEAVKKAWVERSNITRRKVSLISTDERGGAEKPRVSTFSPRGRLTQAMRDAAVKLLFADAPPGDAHLDFSRGVLPVPPRSFTAWCPRLEELEFVFYTDSHPAVSGRLIFPCGAFRVKADSPPFEKVDGIEDPEGRGLWLFQPPWNHIRSEFMGTLESCYRHVSQRAGSLYVSLLDVRDEVCRQLRLSAVLFDHLLETACRETLREAVVEGRSLSISLESDVRPEQQSGRGLLRRPVYVDRVPHSLIALSVTQPIERGTT